MEQTFNTTLTASDLMAKVVQWVRTLETLPAPTNAADITKLCRAVSALMGVLNKLVPVRKRPADPPSAGDDVTAMVDSLLAGLNTASESRHRSAFQRRLRRQERSNRRPKPLRPSPSQPRKRLSPAFPTRRRSRSPT